MENFGWTLAFVRQPLFETAIAVVVSPDRQRYAVLESDGELNMNPQIVIRHSAAVPLPASLLHEFREASLPRAFHQFTPFSLRSLDAEFAQPRNIALRYRLRPDRIRVPPPTSGIR